MSRFVLKLRLCLCELVTDVIICSSDAILNMVNNIAVNVLGGGTEMNGTDNTPYMHTNTLLFSYFTLSRVNIIKAIQISQKVGLRCKCKIKTICGFKLKPYHANIKKISHLTCNPT